jgi:hypothetical protein
VELLAGGRAAQQIAVNQNAECFRPAKRSAFDDPAPVAATWAWHEAADLERGPDLPL